MIYNDEWTNTTERIELDGEKESKLYGKLIINGFQNLSSINIKNYSHYINSIVICKSEKLLSISLDNAFRNAVKVEIRGIT